MRPLFEMHAGMCQALGNPRRLAIMYALKEGEMCVSDLAGLLEISVHNVSQHLRILRQHLLVRSRKEGQTVYYSVTNDKLVQACGLIREVLLEEHRAEGRSLQIADFASETAFAVDPSAMDPSTDDEQADEPSRPSSPRGARDRSVASPGVTSHD